MKILQAIYVRKKAQGSQYIDKEGETRILNG